MNVGTVFLTPKLKTTPHGELTQKYGSALRYNAPKICYNSSMTKEELLNRMARSMARSMEVEGADFHRMQKILLTGKRPAKK